METPCQAGLAPPELLDMNIVERAQFVKNYFQEMIYKMEENTTNDYSVALAHWQGDLDFLQTSLRLQSE